MPPINSILHEIQTLLIRHPDVILHEIEYDSETTKDMGE